MFVHEYVPLPLLLMNCSKFWGHALIPSQFFLINALCHTCMCHIISIGSGGGARGLKPPSFEQLPTPIAMCHI